MSQRVSEHLRRNAYGLVAIFIALSGTAIAANVAKNSVTSKSIKNGQVKRDDLADGAVNATKVSPDSLTGDQIDESSLQMPPQSATGTAGGDLTGEYPNPKIAENVITAAEIVDGTLTGAEIAENAIGPSAIADNAVGPAELANNAVGPTQIADNAVGPAKIADNAIGPAKIADNSVGPTEIADNVVGGSKVADRSLTLADVSSANQAIGSVGASGLLLAGTCTLVTTPLTGAQVGDLVMVVPRSADPGVFTPPVRVTADDQLPLKMCNFSGSALVDPVASVDVFAMRP